MSIIAAAFLATRVQLKLKHEFSIKLSGDSPEASGEITHGANLDPKEILDEVFKRKPGKDIPGQDDKMPDHLKDGAKPATAFTCDDRRIAVTVM